MFGCLNLIAENFSTTVAPEVLRETEYLNLVEDLNLYTYQSKGSISCCMGNNNRSGGGESGGRIENIT